MPRDGREYPPEAVWEAQELYCVVRQTYEQVAEETGVSASTLKRWGKNHKWAEKRENLAQAEADLRADTILARSAMLKKLIKNQDAQTGFAVSALETLAMKQADAARAQKLMSAAAQNELRPIRTREDVVAGLEEAIELKLNMLLQSPEDMDFKAAQDIQKAMAFVETLKPKGKEEKTQAKGVSLKTANDIRAKILGVKK